MQKLSLRNMSLLGLVLMGASALTAAVVPAKNTKKVSGQGNNNGLLLPFSASAGAQDVLSCIKVTGAASCTATEGSTLVTTTGRPGNLADSFVGALNTDQTVGNTSITSQIAGDNSSVVQ